MVALGGWRGVPIGTNPISTYGIQNYKQGNEQTLYHNVMILGKKNNPGGSLGFGVPTHCTLQTSPRGQFGSLAGVDWQTSLAKSPLVWGCLQYLDICTPNLTPPRSPLPTRRRSVLLTKCVPKCHFALVKIRLLPGNKPILSHWGDELPLIGGGLDPSAINTSNPSAINP